MILQNPLTLSHGLLTALGIRTFLYHQDRVPSTGAMLVVSNHRSLLDAPLLMAATRRPVRFACHHYMSQVPILKDLVVQMGCLPLDEAGQGQHNFFEKATHLLKAQQTVGIFPEGAQPMVQETEPCHVGQFHRGFAHLALRSPVQDLAVLPVAIASSQETVNSLMPLKVLSWFDPSEPLFDQAGWHPMVFYHRVNVLVGRPMWITESLRQQYQGKQARAAVTDLTNYCHDEIAALLKHGCV